MTWTIPQIFEDLIELDEHQRIEAKRVSEIGHSVMQTICAFANEPDLNLNKPELSKELLEKINQLSTKARTNKLWPIILEIIRELSSFSDEMSQLLKREPNSLRKKHVLIQYLSPEVTNHPKQASVITEKGMEWLNNEEKS